MTQVSRQKGTMSTQKLFVMSFGIVVIGLIIAVGGVVSIFFLHDLHFAILILAFSAVAVSTGGSMMTVVLLGHIIEKVDGLQVWRLLVPKKIQRIIDSN